MRKALTRILFPTLCLFALAACGQSPVSIAPALEIVPAHSVVDGVVVWDPNAEPALSLSIRGSASDPELAGARWSQEGWGVDLSGRQGPDLRISADSPGCGFGGFSFSIEAKSASGQRVGQVTVRMERYLCAGSPWLE